MSKIARPSYGTGIASLKKSRFSASSSSPSNNADAVTPNIPTPGVQRRSLKSSKSLTSAAPTRRTRSAVARSSLSSTDDVSESEATSRFSGASRTSTPRSSLSRSPTEKQSSSSGGLTVGTRVAVPSLSVVGTLRFVGETKFKPGLWTGIELDFATGKNDGSVQGVRYFTCPANTGLFVLASKITPLTDNTKEEDGRSSVGLTTNRPKRTSQPNDRIRTNAIRPTASKSTRISQTTPPSAATKEATTMQRRRSKQNTQEKSENVSNMTKPMQSRRSQSFTRPEPGTNTVTPRDVQPDTLSTEHTVSEKKATSVAAGVQTDEDASADERAAKAIEENIAHEQELYRIYDMLEKVQQEKDELATQMRGKEATWERLLSAKESYALRVQEKEAEIAKLQHQIQEVESRCMALEQTLEESEACVAKNMETDAVNEQSYRRIEKLEGFVRDLQIKAESTAKEHASALAEKVEQIEQLHRELAEAKTLCTSLESDCEEFRKAGLDAIHAYESSVAQLKQQYDLNLEQKEREINELKTQLDDLRQQQQRERDMLGIGEDMMTSSKTDEADDQWQDQRHRLNEQLENALRELAREQSQTRALHNDIDELREKLARALRTTASSDDRYAALQHELEEEIKDKQRLIEEADAAFESQARAEDENYQMKMARAHMEHELAEAFAKMTDLEAHIKKLESASLPVQGASISDDALYQELQSEKQARRSLEQNYQSLQASHKDIEEECERLMEEILSLEKEKDQETSIQGDPALRKEIDRLKEEIRRQQQLYTELELSKRTQVNQLSRDLAELETLVEDKVFRQSDLEEDLRLEKIRCKELEQKLQRYQGTSYQPKAIRQETREEKNSSANDTHHTSDPSSELYCELCDQYGHDILGCRAPLDGANVSSNEIQRSNSLYCENCDMDGDHATYNCPNQHETF